MKTLVSTSEELRTEAKSFRIINNGAVIDVYQYSVNGFSSHKYYIEITSPILEENNFHLLVNSRNFKIIVSEVKEINRPLFVHHYKKQMFEKDSYECLRTFTLDLPHNNLYIEQSEFDSERHLLKVVLKPHLN